MPRRLLHRFTLEGKRYVVDPETCFCFECDEITGEVLELYPETPINHIYHVLEGRHARKELDEVIGELEWLRAAKSILAPPKMEQMAKSFDLDRGLRRLEVRLGHEAGRDGGQSPEPKASSRGILGISQWGRGARGPATALATSEKQAQRLAIRIQRAAALLIARGSSQGTLRLDLRWDNMITNASELSAAVKEAQELAAMSGKTLHVALGCSVEGAGSLSGHAVTYCVVCARTDLLGKALEALELAISGPRIAAKAFRGLPEGLSGEVALEPYGAHFAEAVEALHNAGILVIDLNLETPYLAEKRPNPAKVAEELQRCATYYAGALLKGDYFRLEPLAGLFHRIYLGEPMPRTDPAGLWSMSVDSEGGIYPSSAFFGKAFYCFGNVMLGTFDPENAKRFEDIGAVTTPVCYTCWARNLCGGGSAAVHAALSGDFRTPDEGWCDAQRGWLETAIAAFNLLSGEGTSFSRLYGQLGRAAKPSIFTMVRAAFQMNIGVRPLGEADAELLTQWHNFNDAAYFTFTETGLLMATKYDREMDAVHPQGHEFEFFLLRKNGAPMGLLKLRPLLEPGTAMVWIYLRDASDYADDGARKSFRFLLGEAGKQQGLNRIIVPCGPYDSGLAEFLIATGFARGGEQREALFLRGGYHDVAWYGTALGA